MQRRATGVLIMVLSAALSGCGWHRSSPAPTPSDTFQDRRELAGTWKLISRTVRTGDGTLVQDAGLGATPTGYLIYDLSGHVVAQIMRADRSEVTDCVTSGIAPSNNSQSVNGYDAYFGTYTVDRTNHTVTHHLDGAIATADLGKNLVRQFELSGDRLNIVVRTGSGDGTQVRTLTWERVR